jgi:hypothetical protein
VGLVDAQEGRPETFKQGSGRSGLERLGSGEDDQAAALSEPLKRRPALGGAEAAVKRDDRNATSSERLLLIRHEGNERRDHDRRPIKNHRRNLIDQRLAKARRQGHQRVASVQNGEHRRCLLGPQALDAEGCGAVCRHALSRFMALVSFFELALVDACFQKSKKARASSFHGR